jgi:hypothetical protein
MALFPCDIDLAGKRFAGETTGISLEVGARRTTSDGCTTGTCPQRELAEAANNAAPENKTWRRFIFGRSLKHRPEGLDNSARIPILGNRVKQALTILP